MTRTTVLIRLIEKKETYFPLFSLEDCFFGGNWASSDSDNRLISVGGISLWIPLRLNEFNLINTYLNRLKYCLQHTIKIQSRHKLSLP